MKKGNNEKFVIVLFLVFLSVCLFKSAEGLAGKKKAKDGEEQIAAAVLTDKDCVKCHTQEPADVAKAGGAHKTKVGCTDCHEGHPPRVMEGVIPQCSKCHTGEKHFELEDCLKCHSNPHTPLHLKLARGIKGPCLTCHESQGVDLDTHKSFHSTLGCTDCHNVHGEIPECFKCHKPHSPSQTNADCSLCHDAHMPLMVAYNNDIPSQHCGACHDEEFNQLASSPTKHHELGCAQCHKDKHKMVPACQDCHGLPHPESILKKFPDCHTCHNNPHDLNRWGTAQAAGAKK